MVKCAWLTDIHLNFIEQEDRVRFYQNVKDTKAEIILISGDISEGPTITSILNEMQSIIDGVIYFVAGNHDYYLANIEEVKNELQKLTIENNGLYWLPATGPIKLNHHTFLIGCDGWADGRLGDYVNSRVVLNDSRLINDLFQQNILGKYKLLDKMQQLADRDANLLSGLLNEALSDNPKKIIVVTHVPPFKEASLYNGEISNDDWLPFFSSKAIGDILYKFAINNKNIDLQVLCGHTHQFADVNILPNLKVMVGRAEYNLPEIQAVFEF